MCYTIWKETLGNVMLFSECFTWQAFSPGSLEIFRWNCIYISRAWMYGYEYVIHLHRLLWKFIWRAPKIERAKKRRQFLNLNSSPLYGQDASLNRIKHFAGIIGYTIYNITCGRKFTICFCRYWNFVNYTEGRKLRGSCKNISYQPYIYYIR